MRLFADDREIVGSIEIDGWMIKGDAIPERCRGVDKTAALRGVVKKSSKQ